MRVLWWMWIKIVFCVIPSVSSTRNLYLIEVCICPLSAKCISNVFSHRTRHRLLSPNNKQPWRCLNIKKVYPGMNISMLEIIRSRDRHFFNTVIPILVRHLDIETAPSSFYMKSETAQAFANAAKYFAVQKCHNERDCVSNHDCLLNRLFRGRSKKTSKLRVTGLCADISPVTDEFPAQGVSNAENVSNWWHRHGLLKLKCHIHLLHT